MSTQPEHLLRSFGRRHGRKLRPAKQSLMDELLPKLQLSPEALEHWYTDALKKGPLWLEIGFGGGEHLAHQAALHPKCDIIGCEPYINGVAGLFTRIKDEKLDNIRILTDDVRPLIARLPDAALSKVFILYPDPWPKARHNKRRLISTEFLSSLARVMKPGAELRVATDDEDYLTWILSHLLAHPDFTWQAKSCADWLTPWSDWISTRYEQKALAAGRVPTYLTFVRRV